MEWIEISICTTSQAVEAISEKLIVLGAYGISTLDPLEIKSVINDEKSLIYADDGYIESLGDDVFIKAYFASIEGEIALGIKDEENEGLLTTDLLYHLTKDQKCTFEELLNYVHNAVNNVSCFLDTGKAEIKARIIDDDDWANSWKKYYKPLKISQRIVIVPSWENYEPKEGEIIVFLDPGSAFGTGSHATTSMCAAIIDELAMQKTGRFLDLGCGSGILSIIAAKLGISDIDAVDIDEVAVKVAKDNINKNSVNKKVNCFLAQASDLETSSYKIIAANIIADVLSDIADDISRLLIKDGYFIASGIINTKKDKVVEKYISLGFKLIETKEKEDWIALVFSK